MSSKLPSVWYLPANDDATLIKRIVSSHPWQNWKKWDQCFFQYIIKCFYVDFTSKVNLCQLKLLDASNPSLIEILKPWNRQKHFDVFMHPEKNESFLLKDHRFNRIFEYCYYLVHYIDNIKS